MVFLNPPGEEIDHSLKFSLCSFTPEQVADWLQIQLFYKNTENEK